MQLSSGIVLKGVVKGGPADNAALKEEDIITELDGKRVADIESFRHEILNSEVGREIRLTVQRKTEEITEKIEVKVTLGERPKSPLPPPAREHKEQEKKDK